MIGREALADFELGGYQLRAGTTVFMSPWVMHHDQRYHARPEVFEPQRWTPERAGSLPKMTYFPFGGGPRICIGNTFAMMESVLLLSTIAQHWSFTLAPGQRIEPAPLFTLRPRAGIRLVVCQRRRGGATSAEISRAAQDASVKAVD